MTTRIIIHLRLVLSGSAGLLALLGNASAADSVSPTLSELTKSGLPRTGLCVHLGARDGAIETALAGTGRWVVQGLAEDDQAVESARKAVIAGGQIGTANIARIVAPASLPYAQNSINLLIADLDGLGTGAPPAAEIDRVLAPYGAAYLRKGGAWSITAKALPTGMDVWTHFYHGPDGNAVSRDKLVKPGTGVQWIAGRQTDRAAGTNCFRLDQGRALYETCMDGNSMLMCRDAFSGVLLWSLPFDGRFWKSRSLVMQDGVIYTHLGSKGQPLVALDAATGKTIRTYDKALPDTKAANDKSSPNLVFADGILYQTGPGQVSAIHAKTGAVVWTKTETGKATDLPTVASDLKHLYYTVGTTNRHGGRFVWHSYNEVVALDLATGKEVWRSPVGDRWTCGLIYADKRLFLIEHINALEQSKNRHRLCLNAVDGKEIWQELFNSNDKKRGNLVYTEAAVLDSGLFLTGPGAWQIDQTTGKEIRRWGEWGNARCDSSRMTENYLLLSFGNLVDLKTGMIRRTDLTRGTCGGGTTPGYGMTYFMPERCLCFDAISGTMALLDYTPLTKVPDARRLTTGTGKASAAQRSDADWPALLGNHLHTGGNAAVLPAKLAEGWTLKVQAPFPSDGSPLLSDLALSSDVHRPITAVTVAAKRIYVAVPDFHRIDCLDAANGKRLWSFTAGGRIDSPPTIEDGHCLFGSHDGCVYALDATSGALIWSYLLAPQQRFMNAHGQVSSAWPIHGSLVVAANRVWAVAGRHPDADGGMVIAALDLTSGRLAFQQEVVRPRPWLPADSKRIDEKHPTGLENGGFWSNRTRNSIMYSDGKKVQLDLLGFDAATGAAVTGSAKYNWSLFEVLQQAHKQYGLIEWMSREDYSGPGGDRPWVYQQSENCFIDRGGKKAGGGDQVISRADRNAYRDDQLVEVARGKVRSWSLKSWDNKIDGDTNTPKRTPTWAVPAPAGSTLAMILTKDQIVVATLDKAKRSTEIHRYALADGKDLGAIQVAEALIENTLAAADGCLYGSFEDGSLRCWR